MGLSKRLISTDAAGGGAFVPDENFAPSIWTGNNSERKISLNFAPDFVYVKKRNTGTSGDHIFLDTIRGIGSSGGANSLYPAYDLAETTNSDANYLKSFDSDGFTIGNNTYFNASPNTYVGWAWKAGGSAVSNTDGTITSSVSANTAAGFSIVKYSGNSTAGATVGHGLTSPQMVIIKCTSTNSTNWIVYADPLGNSNYLSLNDNLGVATFSNWFYSNATTFTLNQTFGNANTSGRDYIAYCFSDVAGYQKIGSYTGSGLSGKRVYTDSNDDGTGTGGFQPRFVLIKCTTNASTEWLVFTSNVVDGSGDPTMIRITQNEGEFTGDRLQFTSDGFTISDGDPSRNGGSRTYLYWAIA